MLDQATIFSREGLVLWSKSFCRVQEGLINDFIKTILIEERSGDMVANLDNYTLAWNFDNRLDLVFLVIYQKGFNLSYIDQLLPDMRARFLRKHGDTLEEGDVDTVDFSDDFMQVLQRAEAASAKSSGQNLVSLKNAARLGSSGSLAGRGSPKPEEDGDGGEGSALEESPRSRLARKFSSRGGGARGAPAGAGEPPAAGGPSSSGRKGKGKKGTVWHDGSGKKKASAALLAELDRSDPAAAGGGGGGGPADRQYEEARATYLPGEGEEAQWVEDEEDERRGGGGGGSGGGGLLSQLFSRFSGQQVLTAEVLGPVVAQVTEELMAKNVAADIATELTASVQSSLEGKKLSGRFERPAAAAKAALREAVLRVLTPKRPVDLLREVHAAQAKGRPFAVAFVGVNGVGKSTSLAKVAYYLREHGCKVLLAACDTFRSGAVEQLGVHARCLDVPLFEKGYAKDPAAVAVAALEHAREQGFDAVLIDTAGRMQNNAPLMRALAKLVGDAQPDRVLFVGEALVGNDGIDQLRMFDEALAAFAPPGRPPRRVDGIVLTKFDTIDTKVGAALSMTYQTGQPVVFVGTGQKYTHLRRLNAGAIVDALFGK